MQFIELRYGMIHCGLQDELTIFRVRGASQLADKQPPFDSRSLFSAFSPGTFHSPLSENCNSPWIIDITTSSNCHGQCIQIQRFILQTAWNLSQPWLLYINTHIDISAKKTPKFLLRWRNLQLAVSHIDFSCRGPKPGKNTKQSRKHITQSINTNKWNADWIPECPMPQCQSRPLPSSPIPIFRWWSLHVGQTSGFCRTTKYQGMSIKRSKNGLVTLLLWIKISTQLNVKKMQ